MLYRENYKRGYLQSILSASALSITLETTAGYTIRDIPAIIGETMRLVIWGVQYPNPSADPNHEIVTATWTGSGQVFTIIRAQEDTTASIHYIGDNVALLLTADMSKEILIFADLENADIGSIGYTDDVDLDGDMEVVPLAPDDEVSDPEGYRKVLVSGGATSYYPYWQFCWADEVGGIRKP